VECAWGVHPTLGPLACVPGVPGIVSELRPGRGSPRPSVDSIWTDQSHQPNHHKRSSGITLSSTLQVFIKWKTAPARLREGDRLSCMQVQAFGPYRERKSTFRSRPPPTPSATNIQFGIQEGASVGRPLSFFVSATAGCYHMSWNTYNNCVMRVGLSGSGRRWHHNRQVPFVLSLSIPYGEREGKWDMVAGTIWHHLMDGLSPLDRAKPSPSSRPLEWHGPGPGANRFRRRACESRWLKTATMRL